MFANTAFSKSGNLRETRRSLLSRDWLLGFCLIGITLIAYGQTWHAGFIWDDESHLTQNPCIIGPLGLKEIWTSTRAVYYPLVLTTFWTLHKFVGVNPVPYHVLNVLMHAGSAVMLWRVLRQLNVRGAWLGAALWALHPVMVQSVAWVTELKNTQSCLFYLLSIFCFLNWEEHSQTWKSPIKSALLFSLSLVCFVLATLTKPSVVMLPIVLALCVWWRRGRIGWKDGVPLAPFLLISALASAWAIWEQKFHASAVGPEWAQTWPERLIMAGRAIWFYLGKLVWPHPLIFIYPRWEIHSWQWMAYLPLLAATLGLIVLWALPGKAGRALFFTAAYYVVSLFPVLGFFSVYFFRYSFVSDHFQNLASMGPLALAGATISESFRRLTVAVSPGRVTVFLRLGLGSILLFLLTTLTWQQTTAYHDLVTLYTRTLAKNPGCWMAHYNLGIALHDNGETDQAITHYRRAIELWPGYAEAHYNLGRLLAEKGEFNDAINHYEATIAINPADAEAHNNLGATLFQAGRVDDAIAHYQEALAVRPDYAEASCNLADALLSKGRVAEAIGQYREALQLAPENVAAQSNLAWLLATSPDSALRNGPEAVLLAEQASRSSDGRRPLALRILAAAYAEAGRFSEARATAHEALL